MDLKEPILKNYPEIFSTLTGQKANLKSEGRILRRNSERIRRSKRFRKQPYQRLEQFQRAFFVAMDDKKFTLFACATCKNVLRAPVTLECGHTFCGQCFDDRLDKCANCLADLSGQKPKVNILVQGLVEKWGEWKRADVPDPDEILGLYPRYFLRSGYAGLQLSIANDNENKNNEFNYKSRSADNSMESKRNKRFRRYCENNQSTSEYFQEMLDNIFKEVDSVREVAFRNSWECIKSEDLECLLCSRCFLDPVTTSCGHTFCRDCLTRVLDHRLCCPLCKTTLSISEYFRGTTEVLNQAIRLIIPDEINSRLQASLGEIVYNNSSEVPVFVCTNAFPGVACPLYVHEPRYRLLVRRCLQSPSKRFAMASTHPTGDKFVQYGTILEVKDAVTLRDGRIILTTLGIRRFRVVSTDECDGYDTAKIEFINDTSPPPDRLSELLNLHQKVFNKASKWVRLLTPSVLSEVERLIGSMPKVEMNWVDLPDGPSWTWWLMPILPLSSQLQIGFLSSTSLEKRLRAIDKMLEHMKVRMKALQRKDTVTCQGREEENMDFCGNSDNC